MFGCLQHFTSCKLFLFSSFDKNYEISFWKIYIAFALFSLINGILYLVCFHFNKIKSLSLYQIHSGIFIICTIIFFGSLTITTCCHFFNKYYAYNEFYKLQIRNYFNISICLSLLLMVLTQLLLPINFVWSLLSVPKLRNTD